MTDTEYLRDLFFEIVQPPFDGDIVEWADGKLKIPYSVRYPIYIAAESPWLIEPLRALSDPMVRRVDVRMPAGAAKSLIGEIQIAHCLAEDPGMYYYVWQTDDDAKDAMEDRIYPMIEANQFLAKKMPVDRNKKRGSKIAAPHMSLYAVGANLSAAQSKRVKFLTMEEPHLYGPGMMTAFEKRVEAVKDPVILTLSTGSVIDDESDDSFNAGSCEVWQVPCKFCGQFQTMTDHRDRLRAQIDKETCDAEGNHIWSKILPTVRYNCEHCDKDWPTDEKSRKDQSALGRFIQTNDNAAGDHRSFHLEAVSVHYFPLANLVMEKIKATIAARRGAMEPLKDYIQKRRAMAWDDEPVDTDQDAAFDRSKGNYHKGEKFEGEIARFICIDNQAGKASKGEGAHRWYVCRALSLTECRVIDEGKIITWEEMEEKRIELGVDPVRTLVDIAFDTAAVQAVCVRYGWMGLWGDNTNKNSFPHHEMILVQGKPTRITRNYPFSRPNTGHVGIGKKGKRRQAIYFFWCQNPIKDMWHRIKNGLSTYRWTVPQDISEDYRKQIQAEYKVTTI
ncbi:MAG: phage terminase large subunit family protein, partial [Deltaproteobacteria bacterium]|nr:phage terminase large subunit family protein [Deltaproteobacteria bacterium]